MAINELIQKIILGEITLSQGMMLAKVLYKEYLSEESYQWICNELEHYDDPDLLPGYRVLDCTIKVVISGYYIGTRIEELDTSTLTKYFNCDDKPYARPDKMLIRQGLESLEKTLETVGNNIQMELGKEQMDLLLKFYSYPTGCRIERMYQESRGEYFRNIIPNVRNRIVSILQKEVLEAASKETNPINDSLKKTVFISYGWDDELHCAWVKELAKRLSEYFEVRIDVKTPFGTDLNAFMEQMITKANRVLLILTPTYKEKADNRQNGVGYESVLISSELYNNQGTTKFIPIVRKGTVEESFPNYLGKRKGVIMTDDNEFETKLTELVDDIKNN